MIEEGKSRYFPDLHMMLTGFDHRVVYAIIDIEKRLDVLESNGRVE
jgi:hypothetical protein